MAEKEPSVLMTVRVKQSVRKKIRLQAVEKDISISKYIEYLVNNDIAEEKRKEQEDE